MNCYVCVCVQFAVRTVEVMSDNRGIVMTNIVNECPMQTRIVNIDLAVVAVSGCILIGSFPMYLFICT